MKEIPDDALDAPEIELTDEDIIDAMRHIPGYIDISTADFRAVYHLAHQHAIVRHFGRMIAGDLMHRDAPVLTPDITLKAAARILIESGYKGLPVVAEENKVVGMLTETDFLKCFSSKSTLELLMRTMAGGSDTYNRCDTTHVSDAMTSPAITVGIEAGFGEILTAFSRHSGQGVPVLDKDGRLCGLLLRKDFIESLVRDYLR